MLSDLAGSSSVDRHSGSDDAEGEIRGLSRNPLLLFDGNAVLHDSWVVVV